MLDYTNPTDPKENPVGTAHLPVSGEVGVGQVFYHDPVTTDTNDDPNGDDVNPVINVLDED